MSNNSVNHAYVQIRTDSTRDVEYVRGNCLNMSEITTKVRRDITLIVRRIVGNPLKQNGTVGALTDPPVELPVAIDNDLANQWLSKKKTDPLPHTTP